MKIKYFKNIKKKRFEGIKTYQNGQNIRVRITADKEICSIYTYPVDFNNEVLSPNNEKIMELSPTEALEELDEFIENIKTRIGYKALGKQLENTPQPGTTKTHDHPPVNRKVDCHYKNTLKTVENFFEPKTRKNL